MLPFQTLEPLSLKNKTLTLCKEIFASSNKLEYICVR